MSKGYQNFTLARRRLPLGPYPVHQTVMTNPVTEEVQIKQENDNVLLKGLAFHRRKKGGGGEFGVLVSPIRWIYAMEKPYIERFVDRKSSGRL